MIIIENKILGINDNLIFKKINQQNSYQILNINSGRKIVIENESAKLFTFLISDYKYIIKDISYELNYNEKLVNKMIENLKKLGFTSFIYEDKKFVLSKNIFFANFNNENYIMNFRNSSIDYINNYELNYLKKGLIFNIHQDRRNYLISRGYLEQDTKVSSTENEILNIYLIFSYKCNLACSYCFEKDENFNIEDSNDDKYIEKLQNISKTHKFMITLYGGEPLIEENRNDINKVINFIKTHSCSIRIITNGVNIPFYMKEFIMLKKYINEFVITVDGIKEIHDIRRYDKNHNGTFENIIKSIIILNHNNYKVKIRVNLDKYNINQQINFLQYISSLELNFSLIIIEYHRVDNKSNINYVPISLISCYNLIHEIIKLKFHFNIIFAEPILNFIYNVFSNTLSINLNSGCNIKNIIVMNKNGKMNICNEAMNIDDFNINDVNKVNEDFNKIEFIGKECDLCKFYQICNGGCILKRYYHNINKKVYCNKDELINIVDKFLNDIANAYSKLN